MTTRNDLIILLSTIVTQLNQAHMGVMQVNAANDSTTSGDGINDTATFGID